MPWTAIQYVSGIATLIAFVVAVAASIYRARLKNREKLIESAEPADRPALVESALEVFHVPTENLTKEQKYSLVLEQIRGRANRFLVGAILTCLLALLGVGAVVFVSKPPKGPEGPEPVPGFDIAIQQPQFFATPKGIRVETPIKFFPVEKYETVTSTVFGGIVSIHDLDKMEADTKYPSGTPCVEIPSCLAVKTFEHYESAPLYVRASGDSDIVVNTSLEAPRGVKTIVVLADFHQRELPDGRRCVVDDSRPALKVGTPPLKAVDRQGVDVGGPCIGAKDRKTFKVKLD